MADKIVIEGIRPYDGSYDFDLDDEPLTTFEWRIIKKTSGYLPLTVDDGMRGGDPDLFCAFAVIALSRAGRVEKTAVFAVADQLADAPFDGSSIRMVVGEDDSPDPLPPTEPPTRSGGASGGETSEIQDSDQSTTGAPV